jgi:hypothetical protein
MDKVSAKEKSELIDGWSRWFDERRVNDPRAKVTLADLWVAIATDGVADVNTTNPVYQALVKHKVPTKVPPGFSSIWRYLLVEGRTHDGIKFCQMCNELHEGKKKGYCERHGKRIRGYWNGKELLPPPYPNPTAFPPPSRY